MVRVVGVKGIAAFRLGEDAVFNGRHDFFLDRGGDEAHKLGIVVESADTLFDFNMYRFPIYQFGFVFKDKVVVAPINDRVYNQCLSFEYCEGVITCIVECPDAYVFIDDDVGGNGHLGKHFGRFHSVEPVVRIRPKAVASRTQKGLGLGDSRPRDEN